jgi:hypothetical protein
MTLNFQRQLSHFSGAICAPQEFCFEVAGDWVKKPRDVKCK